MIDFYFDSKNNVLKNKLNITDYDKFKKAENHFFDLGLKHLQNSKYFSMEPEYMHDVHRILFNDMYDWAGQYRLIDIERYEIALGGLSVQYSPYKEITCDVDETFLNIQKVKLSDLSMDEKLNYIIDVAVKLWHVHPFRDCNTRTLIAFINQYCSSSSLSIRVDLLKTNLDYFRRSLVAASFEDEELGVKANKEYVLKIMSDAFKGNRS